MLAHFDFFGFYSTLLVVACDEKDTIMGYFLIEGGNELSHIYVMPDYREQNLVDILVWKCVEIVKERGFTEILGLTYPQLTGLYARYMEKWGAKIKVVKTPEERADGQWEILYDISEITPDRGPNVRG